MAEKYMGDCNGCGQPIGTPPLEADDIIQINPSHKWGGCLAVVDEVKSFGCQAYVRIPTNDGKPPGDAYIRLNSDEFEQVNAKPIWLPVKS